MTGMSRRAGLSLLELLIALALLALIAGGLAASTGLGIRLYERTASAADHTDEIALRIRLRALLAATEPPSPRLPFTAGLAGGGNGFTLTTLAASQVYPKSAALRVSVASENDGLRLTVDALDDNGAGIETTSRTLASKAAGVSFAYFDATKDPAAWLPEWTDPARLPALVRITVNPGSTPDWPEFVVRLRLGS